MKKHIFYGCGTAIITPFSDNGNDVDYKAFEKLVNFQIEKNIDALIVAGTTGESPVLTNDEKMQLIEIACDLSSGNIPVIAGCGSNNTELALRKCNDAEKKGVDGLLVVTPYYNKSNQEGIIKHYFYIADRVSTPIIVYNVPSRTGTSINPETYKVLSEHKNIVAVKEASNDLSRLSKAIELCGNTIDFYSGNDDLTLPAMALGAKGVISVTSNIIPEKMTKLTHLCLNNNFIDASKIHYTYLELMNAMFCDVNPIPIKSACNMLFGFNDTLRLPLTKLNEKQKNHLFDILKHYSLL